MSLTSSQEILYMLIHSIVLDDVGMNKERYNSSNDYIFNASDIGTKEEKLPISEHEGRKSPVDTKHKRAWELQEENMNQRHKKIKFDSTDISYHQGSSSNDNIFNASISEQRRKSFRYRNIEKGNHQMIPRTTDLGN